MSKKKDVKKKRGNIRKALVSRRISPYVKAWKKFIETGAYNRLTNGDTIYLPKQCEIYLRNRILTTFQTGWDAAEKYYR